MISSVIVVCVNSMNVREEREFFAGQQKMLGYLVEKGQMIDTPTGRGICDNFGLRVKERKVGNGKEERYAALTLVTE